MITSSKMFTYRQIFNHIFLRCKDKIKNIFFSSRFIDMLNKKIVIYTF